MDFNDKLQARGTVQERSRSAWVKKRIKAPLVSNDPTEIEYAEAERAHADDAVLRQMNYAGAATLTKLAEAVEELLVLGVELEATEVVGMIHAVARELRDGA